MEEEKTVIVGSKVAVELLYSTGEREKINFLLTDDQGTGLGTTSIASPLGECIYGKKVGDVGKFYVIGKKTYVKVLSIA